MAEVERWKATVVSAKVLDRNGRDLVKGATVSVRFTESESGIGTISEIYDDQFGTYASVEFPTFTTLSDIATNGRCADLELMAPAPQTNTEER